MEWVEESKQSALVKSALGVGVAISTKLLSLSSFFVFLLLIIFFTKKNRLKFFSIFLAIGILIPLPWFLIALRTTGNPVYPLLTNWFFQVQSNEWVIFY